jgi:hypothetical protein
VYQSPPKEGKDQIEGVVCQNKDLKDGDRVTLNMNEDKGTGYNNRKYGNMGKMKTRKRERKFREIERGTFGSY